MNLPISLTGGNEGVLLPRFERDDFQRKGHHEWVRQPSPSHPELRVRYRGYLASRGHEYQWDLPEDPELLDEHVSWAAYDSLGQLIVARLGIVTRYTLPDLLAGSPSALFDLEPLERPTPWVQTKAVPAIEIVRGNLLDLEVRALIIPASNAQWVTELRARAGDHLKTALGNWSPAPGDVLRTPAYYLRQHDLIHVAEPTPSEGIECLQRACIAVFDAACQGTGDSVALKPIGLDAGWPLENALAVTMLAAQAYVDADPSRRVLIVEA